MALRARRARIEKLRRLCSDMISEISRLRLMLDVYKPWETDMTEFVSEYHDMARTFAKWKGFMLTEDKYPDFPTIGQILDQAEARKEPAD